MHAGRLALVVAAVMATGAGSIGAQNATASTLQPHAEIGCNQPHGPFTTSGNAMLDGAGQRFVPTGMTVFGLSEPVWQDTMSGDEAQMQEMADDWCANTVRIQAAPDNLFPGTSTTPDTAYMAAIEQEIDYAYSQGLNVVLTAQTEHFPTGSKDPNAKTILYWRYVGAMLGNQPDLIFDLFNEPRWGGWQTWKHGNATEGYVGMQTLVNDVRADGNTEMLWVEGPRKAATLEGLSKPINQISGTDLVYDIHHPGGPRTVANWALKFGDLAQTFPVVVGEWSQYAAAQPECWRDGANTGQEVLSFLNYLEANQLGLIAWWPSTGVLVNQAGQPTTIGSDYSCTDAAEAQDEQGAGSDLMQFFDITNSG